MKQVLNWIRTNRETAEDALGIMAFSVWLLLFLVGTELALFIGGAALFWRLQPTSGLNLMTPARSFREAGCEP